MTDRATEDLLLKNRTYAGLLGWSPTDVGALTFDALLIPMIKVQQALLGLDEPDQDGVLGPRTYDKLLEAKIAYTLAHPRKPGVQMTREQAAAYNFADQQQVAVWEVKRLWLTKILDLPPLDSSDYERCRSQIDLLVRTQQGIGWDWQPAYRKNNFKWCGTGPAYGYRKVVPLDTRRTWFASTYRLDRFFSYERMEQHANPKPAHGPYRMELEIDESSTIKDTVFSDGTSPRAGDIALIGPHGTAYGVHICLVEQFVQTSRGCWVVTLEHNGTGYWPDGTKRHGIVRATRPIGLPPGADAATAYIVRRIGRLAPHDLSIALV